MRIYLITNKINKKRYVGQTTQKLTHRWAQHCDKNSCCLGIKRAIEKYGKENFTIRTLYKANSIEELNAKEILFINKFNTLSPNGYNLKTGGNRPVYSEESRKKMSESGKGKIPWNKGLTIEDPRIAKGIKKGKDAFWYGKIGARKGLKCSDEHKLKLSMACKGKANKNSTTFVCNENGKVYRRIRDAGLDLNINDGQIWRVLHGKNNHAKGYTFSIVR